MVWLKCLQGKFFLCFLTCFYSSEILLKAMVPKAVAWQSVWVFHWSWASGSAEKILEDVQEVFWKISYGAKIPVLLILGETKKDLKNFQSLILFLQMTAGWLQSYWNCGVPLKLVAVLAAAPYWKILHLVALEKILEAWASWKLLERTHLCCQMPFWRKRTGKHVFGELPFGKDSNSFSDTTFLFFERINGIWTKHFGLIKTWCPNSLQF